MIRMLVTDLDHTLIYSSRTELGPDRVLVERKDGVPISYLSVRSAGLLAQLAEGMPVVPLTTRSQAQYARICFPGGWVPHYALVANGALLLEGGRPNAAWLAESLRRIAPARQELERGAALLEKDPDRAFELREIDGAFWFSKSAAPEKTVRRLQEKLDPALVCVRHHDVKIYILPRGLDKGAALLRLRGLLQPRRVFCAGDSVFDLSMLRAADVAFAPERLRPLAGENSGSITFLPENSLFSDAFLAKVQQELCEGEIHKP